MSANPPVNRYLRDKAMDHIDHALGRPIWPLRETNRNYFAVYVDSDLFAAFRVSAWWRPLGPVRAGMAFFAVTDAGRKALADHLDALDVGERHQAYEVTFEGYATVVPAKSRAHARYAQWLKISDSFSELSFGDFIRASTVRAA